MSLIVEDGTIVANAESYISVAEADTYHSDRGNTTWSTMLLVEKEQALRRACDYLSQEYGNSWRGYRVKLTGQAMDWPRTGMTYRGRSILSTEIPTALKQATAELAWRAAKGELWADVKPQDYIVKETIGPLSTQYSESAPTRVRYGAINAMLRCFIKSTIGGSNVKRVRV